MSRTINKAAEMDQSAISNFLDFFLLINFLCYASIFPPVYSSNLDYNQLIYKHCENQTSADHHTLSRLSIISGLFQELLERSLESRFFETNAGDEKIAIAGLFQCRGDLSSDDCSNCVNKIPEISKSLCGVSIPARVHLSGCYIHYRADGVIQTSRLQLLHKACSGITGSSGFLEQRDAAFAALDECALSGQGFCDFTYESLHVVSQCDGNLGACDCRSCMNSAVEIAQEECGYSVSGEIYLDGCYVTYGYSYDGTNSNPNQDGTTGGSSSKLVAIVVGGIVAAAAAVALCYFCQSWGKKKDDF